MHIGDLIDGRFALVEQRSDADGVEVWDATDTRLDVPARLWLTTAGGDALLRAGRASRRAGSRHRHAAKVLALGPLEDGAFVAQRVPDGTSLSRVLEAREPLLTGRRALAGALGRALASGPAHGDLATADVVLTAKGPMVLGIGLAGAGTNAAKAKADVAGLAAMLELDAHVAEQAAAATGPAASAQDALVRDLATAWRTLPPVGVLDEAAAANDAHDEAVRLAAEREEARRLAEERAEELRRLAEERGETLPVGDDWDSWAQELAQEQLEEREAAEAQPPMSVAALEWLHRRLPDNTFVARLLERARTAKPARAFKVGPIVFLIAIALLAFAGYQAWSFLNTDWVPDWYTPTEINPYPEFTHSPSVTPSPSPEE